jgi:hypothetical protein
MRANVRSTGLADIRLKVERGYGLVSRAGNREHPKLRALLGWSNRSKPISAVTS